MTTWARQSKLFDRTFGSPPNCTVGSGPKQGMSNTKQTMKLGLGLEEEAEEAATKEEKEEETDDEEEWLWGWGRCRAAARRAWAAGSGAVLVHGACGCARGTD
ncbi:hypothetical protein TRIUR3_10550 [Triticum urartu]|uniref:Uncharacterized protein n=1 Tax=Triticum urartu TaxID=4572 RepID=M7YJ53_TRIUA|nr:hypothetical protein TRIUR3_10550 [Triticum urartu]